MKILSTKIILIMFANILSTVTSVQGGQDTQQINGIEMMNCRLPHSLILKKIIVKWQLPSQSLSPSDEDKSALLFVSYWPFWERKLDGGLPCLEKAPETYERLWVCREVTKSWIYSKELYFWPSVYEMEENIRNWLRLKSCNNFQ